jgi:hypothetical protein
MRIQPDGFLDMSRCASFSVSVQVVLIRRFISIPVFVLAGVLLYFL